MAQDELAKEIVATTERMATARSSFDASFQAVRDYIRPQAAHFSHFNSATHRTKGAIDRDVVVDNTAEDASEDYTNALNGFLHAPGQEWFNVVVRSEAARADRAAQIWLQTVGRIMLSVFESPDSGFGQAIGQLYGEWADFGTGVMFIEDRPGKIPLYRARALAECYIAENSEGRIDTLHRVFMLTARQAEQKFGRDKLGPKIARAAASNSGDAEHEFQFIHAVFPRTERRLDSRLARDMAFASVYVDREDGARLRTSGFRRFPYVVPRRQPRPGEVYGRGLGMKALPDTKMLQRIMTVTIRASEKAIKPPLAVADDGVMGPVNVGDNSINFFRAELLQARQFPIQAINTGARPDIGEDTAEGVRNRIRRIYFNDRLQLPRGTGFKATHIIELTEEALRVIGPDLGTLQNEAQGPQIAITFDDLLEAGAFPPMPPSLLEGAPIEVEYVSPLAKAQRLSEVTALSRLDEIGAGLERIDPAVSDNLDADKAYRRAADRLGVPLDLLRDADEVATRRRTREEETARATALEQAGQAASAAQSAGQAAAAFSGASGVAGNA